MGETGAHSVGARFRGIDKSACCANSATLRLRVARATITVLLTAGFVGGCSAWIPVSSDRSPATDQSAQSADDWRAINNLVAASQPAVKKLATMPVYSDAYMRAAGPSTLEYVYVYAHQVNAASAQPALDSSAQLLQSTVDTTVGPAMQKAGISRPQVTYTYLNPDGSLVWTRTFHETKQSS